MGYSINLCESRGACNHCIPIVITLYQIYVFGALYQAVSHVPKSTALSAFDAKVICACNALKEAYSVAKSLVGMKVMESEVMPEMPLDFILNMKRANTKNREIIAALHSRGVKICLRTMQRYLQEHVEGSCSTTQFLLECLHEIETLRLAGGTQHEILHHIYRKNI